MLPPVFHRHRSKIKLSIRCKNVFLLKIIFQGGKQIIYLTWAKIGKCSLTLRRYNNYKTEHFHLHFFLSNFIIFKIFPYEDVVLLCGFSSIPTLSGFKHTNQIGERTKKCANYSCTYFSLLFYYYCVEVIIFAIA